MPGYHTPFPPNAGPDPTGYIPILDPEMERVLADRRKYELVRKTRAVEELTRELASEGVETPTMDYLRKKGMVTDPRYSYGTIRRGAVVRELIGER